MRYLKHIFLLTAIAIWSIEQVWACAADEIQLLAPFGSATCIKKNPTDFLGTWLNYWSDAVIWAFNLGMALTTLWVLWGGVLIITAGIDGNQRAKGIGFMKQGLIGLLAFVFAGSILYLLNSMFFHPGT